MAKICLVAMVLLFWGINRVQAEASSDSKYGPRAALFAASYLQDKTGELSMRDMLQGGMTFSALKAGKTDFGFTKSVYWVKVDLASVSEETRYYLELAYPLMDDIEFSLVCDGKVVEHYQTGFRRPFAERPLLNRNFVFPMVLSAGIRYSAFLRLANADRMEIPLYLWGQDQFIESSNVQLLILGLYFGFVVLIALYNLFMFAVLRFPAFLLYVTYILLFGFFMATQNGLSYEFLWPQSWDNHKILPQTLALFELAVTVFLWVFFENPPEIRRYKKYFTISEVVLGAFFICSYILNYTLAIQLAAILLFCQATFLMYVGSRLLLRGNRTARYVMLAFSFLLVGGALYWLKILGIVESNFISSYGLQIGSALEISLLSLAISARFHEKSREMNEMLEKANEEKSKLNVKINRELEEITAAKAELDIAFSINDTLLKEVHHRVKNNLQIISSLLKLQSHRLKDAEAKGAIDDSVNRIFSMALIHEELYKNKNLAQVSLGDYIQELSTQILQLYEAGTRIEMRLALDEIPIEIDQAIPCGLIVNEIITNSVKHAFPPGGSGRIAIELHESEGRACLRVTDNGSGLPAGIDIRTASSLGLQLVRTLSEQLHGQTELRGTRGTVFEIEFPIEPPKPWSQ